MHQAPNDDRVLVDAIEEQDSVKRTYDRKRAQPGKFGMTESANTTKGWLSRQSNESHLDRLLKP
jgi:hypothetical protein